MSDLEWPDDGGRASGVIDGPAGPIEVDIDLPDDPAEGFVVVCHPHPQQGGTKDNKVVYMLARAATQAGLAALRFNFRGVGRSGGDYDDGNGEQDDARAVRDWAADASGLRLAGLAGFSFGSAVALRVAAADGAPTLVTVGLPSAYFDEHLPRPDSDWLALFASDDEVIDADAAIAAVHELAPAVAVEILEGAGHFLHGRLTDLRKRVVTHWQDSTGNDR